MNKYIPAEKLIAEIERLRDIAQGYLCGSEKQSDLSPSQYRMEGIDTICSNLLFFITSLQQEQPEVNEDFFFDEVLKVYDDNNKYPPRSEEELTMLETIARHFWNKGYNARKEEAK